MKLFYFIISLLVAIMAIFYVWLRIEQVRYGYILSQKYEHLMELKRTNEKLKLEWSLITNSVNLQEIAQREFSMRPPKNQEIIYLPVPPSLLEKRSKEPEETRLKGSVCF